MSTNQLNANGLTVNKIWGMNGSSSTLLMSGGNIGSTGSSNPILVLEDSDNIGTISFLTNAGTSNYSSMVNAGDNLIFSNYGKNNPTSNLDIFVATSDGNSNGTPNGIQIAPTYTSLFGGATGTTAYNCNSLNVGADGINLNANQGNVNINGNVYVSDNIYGISSYNDNSTALTVYGGNTTTTSSDAVILVLNDVGNVGTIAFLTNANIGDYSPIVNTGDNLLFSKSTLGTSNLDIFVSTSNGTPNGVQISENSTTMYGGTDTSMNSIVVSPNGIIMNLGVGEVDVSGGFVSNWISTSSLSISNGGSIYGTYSISDTAPPTTVSISGGNTTTTGSSDVPILILNDLGNVGQIQFLTNANADDYSPIVNTGDNLIFSRSNVGTSNLDILMQSSSPNGVQISQNSTTMYGGGAGTNPTNCNSLVVGPTGININANNGNVNVNGYLNVGNYDPSGVLYNLISSYNNTSNKWTSIAISETGQYQTAVNGTNVIYTSSTYGQSWTTNDVSYNCYSVSMSNSGQYQLITTNPNYYTSTQNTQLYYSTSYSGGFSLCTPQTTYPFSVAVSPDGTFFVYASYFISNQSPYNQYLTVYSVNTSNFSSTTNWTQNFVSPITYTSYYSCSLSSSNNGSIINFSYNNASTTPYNYYNLVLTNGSYVSKKITFFSNIEVTGNAMSDNGQYWLICSNSSGVYISSNYGSSFTQLSNLTTNSANAAIVWSSCSVSSTGQYQSVVSTNQTGNSYIYVSNNYGSSFQLLNTSSNNWSSVSMADYYFGICGNNSIETYVINGLISANSLKLNNMLVSGMQCGTTTTINGQIAFPTPFASPPIVVATAVFSGTADVYNVFASVNTITNTGFNYIITSINLSTSPQTVTSAYPVNWIAML